MINNHFQSTLWKTTLLLIVSLFGLVACGAVETETESESAANVEINQALVNKAVEWLITQHQNDDGGYASFSGGANLAPSDVGGTLDAVLALVSAGVDLSENYDGESGNPLSYLIDNVEAVKALAEANGGQAGRLIMALFGAGQEPTDFMGLNIVEILESTLQPDGTFGTEEPYNNALAILGLAAAGAPIDPAAIDWLEQRQAENGSWDNGYGSNDNSDATAMAIMALVAAGRDSSDPGVSKAIEFLRESQYPSGGWAYLPEMGPGTNSTALVVQALLALRENVTDPEGAWSKDGQSPMDTLLSFQSETGAFQSDFGDGLFDDFFATVQAILAIAGQTFPIYSD